MSKPTNENQPEHDEEPMVEIPAQEQEMIRLREERDQFEQQLQRAMADTANIRRRHSQELSDARRRTLEGLTQELLPVLDTFALALQAYDSQSSDAAQGADPKALVEGVRMVKTMLSGALERHGLQEIPAQGQPFDPARHEALGVEPTDEVPENHVTRVLQTGYAIGDHIVRHSKVMVAGKKPQ